MQWKIKKNPCQILSSRDFFCTKRRLRTLGRSIVGAMKGGMGVLHHHSIPIIQKDLYGNFIAEFAYQNEATRITGVNACAINNTLTRSTHKGGGFKWEYKTPWMV